MAKFIEAELQHLKKELGEMWTLVYNQLDRVGEAVLTNNRELAEQVLVRESRVNAFELKIDSDIEDMIALYNPVGVDLRLVLAVSKINSNLERLGDFAEGIARFMRDCDMVVFDADLIHRLNLNEMIKEVLEMLYNAKQAMDEENIDMANSVFMKDNVVDEINAAAPHVLAQYIQKDPSSTLFCLNMISVFRKLERAGDHITNIAEEIVFYIDAKVLKHQGKAHKETTD
ncbi:MAG: phosphate signaling complex protein PhoU [Prevotellaceae bacterium]|jgi:phosphate transport system protein|nr:phosphate signaling complex protein PhoU [Prevotellaceae bacterium]